MRYFMSSIPFPGLGLEHFAKNIRSSVDRRPRVVDFGAGKLGTVVVLSVFVLSKGVFSPIVRLDDWGFSPVKFQGQNVEW